MFCSKNTMAVVALSAVNKDNYAFIDPRNYGNCLCWLDAADASTFSFSSGTTISQWRDKSGNNRNVQPNIGSVTYTTVGGYNVVSFPAAGSNMISTLNIPTISAGVTNIFIVVRPTALFGTSGLNYFFQYPSSTDYSIRFDSTYKLLGPGTANTGDIGYINASTSSYIINGTAIATSNPALNNSFNIIYTPLNSTRTNSDFILSGNTGTASNARFFIGYMCEVLIYSTLPTLSQRQLIETYLGYKWGIQSLLPTGLTLYKQVPRAVQFNPLSFNNCVLWLDASDTSTLTLSSGTNVTGWADKSGAGNNATYVQRTSGPNAGSIPTTPPTYNSAGMFVSFARASAQYLVTTASSSAATETMFVVASTSGTGGTRSLIGGSPLNAKRQCALDAGSIGIGSQNAGLIASANFASSAKRIMNYNMPSSTTGASTTFFANGTSLTLTGSGNFTFTAGGVTWIGAQDTNNLGTQPDNFFNGGIYELLIFQTATSTATQRQMIEGYLAQKWGLRTSLPTTHSFYSATSVPQTPLFEPNQLSTAISAWYDGRDPNNDIASIPTNGATLATWTDKSGNARNGTGVNNPTYSLTTKGVQLVSTLSQYYTATISSSLSTETIVGVFRLSSLSERALLGPSGGSGGRQIGTRLVGSDWRLAVARAGVSYVLTNTSVSLATNTVYMFTYTAAAGLVLRLSLYGGTAASASGVAAFTGTTSTQIGAYNGGALLDGTIHELVFFSSTLSTNDIQRIEGYLAWKWNLNGNLPVTHPYYKVKP
jgi:hypothetical protein